jgi:hypothetical protein
LNYPQAHQFLRGKKKSGKEERLIAERTHVGFQKEGLWDGREQNEDVDMADE